MILFVLISSSDRIKSEIMNIARKRRKIEMRLKAWGVLFFAKIGTTQDFC